ncbi:hypothetical protein LTR56_001323 [Elasticomyces elasticus]|nr:hypothetical protein LTR56_001323 [Elasticomyces elasticus]KAK3667504.1 hypothetical protein LTR22_001682 [Elasticomyces elasticus]KAK4928016.1 hypothetical protein LTR49_005215 [Elasticomyces elasticus]KAK5762455.1 hypothetical protein LTS12_007432 [Elasticomyces elasticus]
MFRFQSAENFILAVAALASTVTSVSLPGCQEAAPKQNTLHDVRTATLDVPGTPWGIGYAAQADRAFVTLTGLSTNGSVQFGNGSLSVLDTSLFPPTLLHQIPLPQAFQPAGKGGVAVAGIAQLAISPNGRRIFVAADQGAIILDAPLAIANSPKAVIGTLNGTTSSNSPGAQAVQMTLPPDSKYVIISQEHGNGSAANISLMTPGNLNVFKMHHTGQSTGSPLGSLNLGYNVAGTAISPNGRHLYVTSERYTAAGIRLSTSIPCSELVPGFFSVIDLHELERTPAQARHLDVPAGYAPVRVRLSHHGKVIWVLSRESNALEAYDAAKIHSCLSSSSDARNNASDALIATVQVGNAPVDFIFVRNETRIVTADSDRFNYTGSSTGLTVVDVEMALEGNTNGSRSVLGRVPTYEFPRAMALSPDGQTMLVTQYDSGKIQAVDVRTLP